MTRPARRSSGFFWPVQPIRSSNTMLPHPFREVTVERDRGGRPGFRDGASRRLQLRVSAGFAPASPSCPCLRCEGRLCRGMFTENELYSPYRQKQLLRHYRPFFHAWFLLPIASTRRHLRASPHVPELADARNGVAASVPLAEREEHTGVPPDPCPLTPHS